MASCELCGSARHERQGCSLAVLAALLPDDDEDLEASSEAGDELDRLFPGAFDARARWRDA